MIKRFTILLLILFTLVTSLFSQSETLLRQLVTAEKTNNADLYYDLGVDFYAQGANGYANLCWLRALNLNSAHRHARANLELAQRLSPDFPLYSSKPFLIRVVSQSIDFFSVNRLALYSLILLVLAGLASIWLLAYDPTKERALPIMVLSLLAILMLSCFSALGIKYYRQKHNDQAVLIESHASLYDAQGKKPVLDIHAGLVMKVISKDHGDWLVRLPNGQVGKVSAKAVETIN